MNTSNSVTEEIKFNLRHEAEKVNRLQINQQDEKLLKMQRGELLTTAHLDGKLTPFVESQ